MQTKQCCTPTLMTGRTQQCPHDGQAGAQLGSCREEAADILEGRQATALPIIHRKAADTHLCQLEGFAGLQHGAEVYAGAIVEQQGHGAFHRMDSSAWHSLQDLPTACMQPM